ncbi:MAG: glycoside hydrolase family 3 protein [Selenomonadaceae bacterium]|nr:glycoside hydrolase family 3 protein [Selenomonadaceae bacterium]
MRNKRSRSLAILPVMALLIFLAAVGGGFWFSVQTTESSPTEEAVKSAAPSPPEDKVESILKSMSVTEKIGQMVMVGVTGTEISDTDRYLLRQFHIGGIILFDRNIIGHEQTQTLLQNLQAYAAGQEAKQKIPLLVAIDEEGGRVARGRDVITPPPSQQEIGAVGDPELARNWAKSTAKELKGLGINVNFAPVADVGTGDNRFYSADPTMVATLVNSAAAGYEEEKLIYTLKHFPGIGKGLVDSHQEVSAVTSSGDTLKREDILPFKTVIENHPAANFFIMVSHLIYPALDEENSASISPKIMQDLLRGELGYQGVIITDDMAMGAVAKHETMRQLGVRAVQAGADIVLICHEFDHQNDIYMGLYDAYKAGEISEERLNESVRRILKAKLAAGM